MTKIEMQTMNALINLSREYTKQNSFIEVHGYTKESVPIMPDYNNEEQLDVKYHTYKIRVRNLKRIEELDNGNYELLFDVPFSNKLTITQKEFEDKIEPLL